MLISGNAYLILGLPSDADEKLLNKRHKEILKLLEIDEVPEYENDLSFIDYKFIRTPENTKGAFHDLTNQKKRLYQDFLWFQLVTGKDENLFKKVCSGELPDAIEGWQDLYSSTGKYHYLKNMIIANLLGLENKKRAINIKTSKIYQIIAKSLHECIESDKFWKEFSNIINLSAETQVSESELKNFRLELPQYLAEEIFDLSEEIKAPGLYNEYSEIFNISAKELDDNKNVTKPLSIIEKNSEIIKKLKLETDYEKIFNLTGEIVHEINALKNIGLGKNQSVVKIIEKISLQFRDLLVNSYVELKDVPTALFFSDVILSLKPPRSIIQKVDKDIQDIKDIIIKNTTIENFVKMFEEGNKIWDKDQEEAKKYFYRIRNYIEDYLADRFELNKFYLQRLKEKTIIYVSNMSKRNDIFGWTNEAMNNIMQRKLKDILDFVSDLKKHISDGGGFSRGNDFEIGLLTPDERGVFPLYIEAIIRCNLIDSLREIPLRDPRYFNASGYDNDGYDKDGYDRNGYDRNGYDKEGFDKNGYNRKGINKTGFTKNGYDKFGYNRQGINRNGYDRFGYDLSGWSKNGINRDTLTEYDNDGYDKDGYNKLGWNKTGINKLTGKMYDKEGYDEEGYDKKLFNRRRIHKITGTYYDEDGYDRFGYDKEGYDKKGYNKEGYNRHGYDKEGYDKKGYNIEGYNRDGYDKKGYDKKGYDIEGYDRNGYDKKGYDKEGYDRNGYDKNGYDRDGYDKKLFNRKRIHKITGTYYDEEGYDRFGYNKEGYNRKGYDTRGFNSGLIHESTGTYFDMKGYDFYGYNIYGYNEEGYDKDGYDKKGYDKNGYDENGNKKPFWEKLGLLSKLITCCVKSKNYRDSLSIRDIKNIWHRNFPKTYTYKLYKIENGNPILDKSIINQKYTRCNNDIVINKNIKNRKVVKNTLENGEIHTFTKVVMDGGSSFNVEYVTSKKNWRIVIICIESDNKIEEFYLDY